MIERQVAGKLISPDVVARQVNRAGGNPAMTVDEKTSSSRRSPCAQRSNPLFLSALRFAPESRPGKISRRVDRLRE